MKESSALKVALLFVILFSQSLFAISDEAIMDLWTSEKADILVNSLSQHNYTGTGNKNNYYAQFDFPEGKIDNPLFLITGLEDPVPTWFDTVLLAKKQGFRKVYIVEIRAQGESEREGKRNIIHVDNFESYYKDLALAFYNINKRERIGKPIYLIAHSTGALLFSNGLDKIKNSLPSLSVKAMAFWTPLFVLNISPVLNNPIVKPIISFFNNLYRKCCGLYLARSYGPKDFESNTLTHDPAKFKRSEDLKFKFKLGTKGVSLHWALESIDATKNVLEKVKRLDFPLIIFKAGKEEIVSNDYQIDKSNISVLTVPEARHALNIERDLILNSVWIKTIDFWKIAQ